MSFDGLSAIIRQLFQEVSKLTGPDTSNEINLNRVIQFENCFSNAKPGLRRMFPNQNQAKQSIFDQQLRVISKHTEFL